MKPISLIVIILAVFFWKVLFFEYDLTGMIRLYNDSLYRLSKPEEVKYSFWADASPILQSYPWNFYIAESIRKGFLPLWNPYNITGAPFLANWQSTPFFPLKAVFYIRPDLRSFNIYLILCLLMAGVSTYALARELRISKLGAFFSSLTYMLCGYSLTRIAYVDNITASCFPLLLLAAEKNFAIRRFYLSFPFIVALVIFSGHPETSALIIFASVIYGVTKYHRLLVSTWPKLMISYGLGFLVTSVMIFPFMEYLLNAEAHRITLKLHFTFFHPAKEITGLFFPFIYSRDWSHTYIGITCLGLFLLHTLRPSRSLPFLAIFLAGFIFTFFSWFLALFSNIPFFSYIDPLYAIPLLTLPMSIMAGMALDDPVARKKKDRNAFFISLLLIVIVISIILFFLDWRAVDANKSRIAVQICFFLLFGCVGLIAYGRKSILFVALQIIDLFLNGWKITPVYQPFPFPETPAIKFLKGESGVFRIIGLHGSNCIPNISILHHFNDVRINEPILPSRYYKLVKETDEFKGLDITTQKTHPRYWDFLNVKYVIQAKARTGFFINSYPELREQGIIILQTTFPYTPINDPDLSLVYSDRYVNIYKNLHAYPRAFVVHEAIFARTPDEAQNILWHSSTDLRKTVILEGKGEEKSISQQFSRGSFSFSSNATIIDYETHRVKIQAKLNSPGFLVLLDTYYPGWKVYIDGAKGTIFPANYAFRGVYLDKGEHEVLFEYRSISFILGLLISILVIFCIAVAKVLRW